ncbi:signal transduction histidine kinase [Lachnospiraceae bacterium PF1-22]|uniref:sensor histidine kinase n=1 Tax=Ohessyouella blattaphilus TaxID=2949333 RepID=UPI003E233DD2
MDRKGSQKIIKYAAFYLAFLLLFASFLYLLARNEATANRQQMLLLIERHPELEGELISLWEKPEGHTLSEEKVAALEEKYGYKFTQVPLKRKWRLFGLGGVLVGTIFFGVVIYSQKRRGKNREYEDIILEVYECLERFRGGEFGQVPEYGGDSALIHKLLETLKELGQYFEDLSIRLAQEENTTKALITDISHQLKTPLASLRMSHELVANGGLSREEEKEFKEQEDKEIEKLENLLNELVNLSRLETRIIQLKPERTSLKKTILGAVNQNYMKARKKGIQIQLEMKEDLMVYHDGKWTEEALANVLDNAVKYSPEETVITLRVSSLVMNVLIEVDDEGMGIRTEEMQQIYQRFFRGREARETVAEGVGVGLYLARMILERQGGAIYAKRKMERGTVFKITLPTN